MSKYGFESLNRTLGNNNNKTQPSQQFNFIVGKVVDVIRDSSHPQYENYGGVNSIGTIFFVNYSSKTNIENIKYSAKRFNSNYKKFPLKNELVLILPLNASTNGVKTITDYYYLDTINVHQTNHFNIVPSIQYLKDNTLPTEIEEDDNISSINTKVGDIALEGRYNHGLLFSNSKNNKSITEGNNNFTILFNSSKKIPEPIDGYDIDLNNNEDSFILITKDKIKYDFNLPFYTSNYTPLKINQYNKNQLFLKSNRILLRSDIDELILSGNKQVYIVSENDVNIESINNINIQSSRINLGSKQADEPVLYGNQTNELLIKLIDQLESITDSLSRTVSTTPGTPLGEINIVSKETNIILNQLKNTLISKKLLSNKVFI